MLDESQVQALNAKVAIQGLSFQEVAADFIRANSGRLGISEQDTAKIETPSSRAPG